MASSCRPQRSLCSRRRRRNVRGRTSVALRNVHDAPSLARAGRFEHLKCLCYRIPGKTQQHGGVDATLPALFTRDHCKWCLRPVTPVNAGEPTVEVPTRAMQTRTGHQAGARIFQVAIPLSETTGFVVALGPAYTQTKIATTRTCSSRLKQRVAS